MGIWSNVGAVVLLAVLYHAVIRRWHLHWGTRGDETTRAFPCDDFVTGTSSAATRAISIHAAAADVRPWLVQIGQGRAGFYSDAWLEKLFGCRTGHGDEIVPEWQYLEVGDPVVLHPRVPPLRVLGLEPNRVLVPGGCFEPNPTCDDGTPDSDQGRLSAWSWTFVLDEHHDNLTRLIVRTRTYWGADSKGAVFNYMFG